VNQNEHTDHLDHTDDAAPDEDGHAENAELVAFLLREIKVEIYIFFFWNYNTK
jgi:hypothetical protein